MGRYTELAHRAIRRLERLDRRRPLEAELPSPDSDTTNTTEATIHSACQVTTNTTKTTEQPEEPACPSCPIVPDDLRQRLRDVRRYGIEVEVDEGQLLLHTVDEPLAEEQRAGLLASCDPSQGFEKQLLRMLLREIPHHREEVHVPWLAETLWLVAPDGDREILTRKGIRRGQIWTVSEAVDLFRVPSHTPAIVQSVVRLKSDADLEIVGWVEEEPSGKPLSWYCLSTFFWESVHGTEVCAVCHPPAVPHLVKRWLDEPVPVKYQTPLPPLETLRPGSKRVARQTAWAVYRTKTGGLDAHHVMLAHLVDPKDIVARVTARSGATAIRAVLEQSTRGP